MDGVIKVMKSRTIVGNCRSEKFFGVDVHRGSVLTPLLLIVMQEALITEFRIDCTKWLLNKYDPVIKAESMEELLVKLDAWKYWKEKALHVNIII